LINVVLKNKADSLTMHNTNYGIGLEFIFGFVSVIRFLI
jgi:hypothetical protein